MKIGRSRFQARRERLQVQVNLPSGPTPLEGVAEDAKRPKKKALLIGVQYTTHKQEELKLRLKREQWNVGRNRLVYGQQEGQVWDSTAYDRREKARAVGKGTPLQRSVRATLCGAGVKPL